MIDRARVLHVAKLAALSLSDAEADTFARELATIVAYVEQLETLDTKDVPATAHVQLDRAMPEQVIATQGWREDEPRPGLAREEVLAQAPRVEGDGFAVPPFMES
jgi:aspartyl-tRNA(Asn)/glutamyl-tRNA(Gln) amidotransferase subunit C